MMSDALAGRQAATGMRLMAGSDVPRRDAGLNVLRRGERPAAAETGRAAAESYMAMAGIFSPFAAERPLPAAAALYKVRRHGSLANLGAGNGW